MTGGSHSLLWLKATTSRIYDHLNILEQTVLYRWGGSTAAAAEAADDAAPATSAAAAAAATAAAAFLVIASTFRNIANVVTACRQTYYLGTLNKICIKNYYKVLTSAMRSI